ncbi:glycerate kinase [Nocardioides sp. NPDC051685]|uniref:glycerate kinase n=1 Tax=Nocardioides sp. NPDC051685 TaxID=3364334 RepID=UPI0037980B8C
MTVIVAPDSFKGTHSAPSVADAIARGLEAAGARTLRLPVADGGEGTLDVLRGPLCLDIIEADGVNPWGSPSPARWGLSPDGIAVVEVAQTCGLTTTHDGIRDPRTADTVGVGLQIAHAARRGAREIVVAAGGSATTDGGVGAISAIEAAGGLSGAAITVLSDVRTRYCDAATVFGPQKGADAEDVEFLTRRLHANRAKLPRDPHGIEGSGAAGGLAGGLWAQFDARIVSGAGFVLDALGFAEAVTSARAVIVGEGRLDAQTAEGKIISEILLRSAGVPVHAVVGSVEDNAQALPVFADIRVASTIVELEAAGRELGARYR